MHRKYAEMLDIVVQENMKLGDNTPEQWEVVTYKHEFSGTNLTNCNSYFTGLQYINNLETQRSYKTTVDLKNLNLSSNWKIICSFENLQQERLDTY